MKLNFQPASQNLKLLAEPVKNLVQNWHGDTPVEEIMVAEIDPKFMGANELCQEYDIAPEIGANCVIIEAVRGEERTLAACLISVTCKRADFNGVVRKHLNARRISMAPLDEVLNETKMEYGSITPFGLPEGWPILIDPYIISQDRIIIGSGLQKSKLSLPGKTLLELPNAMLLEGLCKLN